VDTLDLVKILLHVGRSLGGARPPGLPVQETVGVDGAEEEAVRETAGGWITVNLTRLVFPPRCCDCGEPTNGRQKFSAYEPFLGPGRLLHPARSEAVSIWVPVCYACQTANQGRFLRAVFTGLGLALGAILLAAVGARLLPGNPVLSYVVLLTLLMAPLLGCFIGYRVGKAQSEPVQLRDFAPARGTVALRFRREAYAAEVAEAMKAAAAA
jgi:hypothetical protein